MGDNDRHLAGGYLRHGAPPFHPSAAAFSADGGFSDQVEPLAEDFRGCFWYAAAPNDDVGCSGRSYTDDVGYTCSRGFEALAAFSDPAEQPLGGGGDMLFQGCFFGQNIHAFGFDSYYTDTNTNGYYASVVSHVGIEALAAFSDPAEQPLGGGDELFHDCFFGQNIHAFGFDGYYTDTNCYYASIVSHVGVEAHAAFSDTTGQLLGGVGLSYDGFSGENVHAFASDGYNNAGRGHSGEPSSVDTLAASSDRAVRPDGFYYTDGYYASVANVGVEAHAAFCDPTGQLLGGVGLSYNGFSGENVHASASDGYNDAGRGHSGELSSVDTIAASSDRAVRPDGFYYTDGYHASVANVGIEAHAAFSDPTGQLLRSVGLSYNGFSGENVRASASEGYNDAGRGHNREPSCVDTLAASYDRAVRPDGGGGPIHSFFSIENVRAFGSDGYNAAGHTPNVEPVGVQTSSAASSSDAAVQPLGWLFHGPSCSSWSGDPFELISETAVQSVWRDNYAEVFEHVVAKLRQPHRRLYIALDLEFVADASTKVHLRPFSWNEWYDHLHTFVNGGDVVQVGVALAFELERHGGAIQVPSPVIALEINLKFDVAARQYNGASVAFLEKQGHCLAELRDRGVTAEQFLDGFLRHLPFGDDSVTWVTYHGDRDFGFLLRLLQPGGRGDLPPERAAFMRQVRKAFPIFYDVRVLGQVVKDGFSGKLTALAEELLSVQRIGVEHNAGSDALLTMSSFSEIVRLSQHELHRLHSRQSLLSGMEEYDMAIKCARHIGDASFTTVKVRGHNFDEEARRIVELVTSNFMIVGVEVLLPQCSPFCCAAVDEQKDYDLMKSRLEGISEFQVEIGFMNAEGMLAFGRVWKFYLRCSNVRTNLAGGNSCVDPQRLAWLLASCGATHNPDVVWAMCQGLEGIACLIMSSMAAGGGLPDDWCSYVERRRRRFPRMYDVGLIAAQRWPDIGGLYEIARNLEIIKDEDEQPMEKVLLVLRCYKRLEESPHFPLIASAVQGLFDDSLSLMEDP